MRRCVYKDGQSPRWRIRKWRHKIVTNCRDTNYETAEGMKGVSFDNGPDDLTLRTGLTGVRYKLFNLVMLPPQ